MKQAGWEADVAECPKKQRWIGWKRLICQNCVQIAAVKTALGNVPEETRGNVEKKQARTYEELQAEQAEQEQACPCPFLCLVKSIHGPAKLPAGSDTAPERGIPAFWMPFDSMSTLSDPCWRLFS